MKEKSIVLEWTLNENIADAPSGNFVFTDRTEVRS